MMMMMIRARSRWHNSTVTTMITQIPKGITYQAQRPFPPLGSSHDQSRVSDAVLGKQRLLDTTIQARTDRTDRRPYLSTSLAREDILLHGTIQIVIHDGWMVLDCVYS